jgi:hypothetical protein
MVTRLACALAAIVCAGCVGSLGGPRASEPRCVALDESRVTWSGVALVAAPVAGAQGAASWPVESSDARLALAVGSVTAAGVAALSGYLAQERAAQYSRECLEAPSAPVVVAPPPSYGARVVSQ